MSTDEQYMTTETACLGNPDILNLAYDMADQMEIKMVCPCCSREFSVTTKTTNANNRKYCSPRCQQRQIKSNAKECWQRGIQRARDGRSSAGLVGQELAGYRAEWKRMHGGFS